MTKVSDAQKENLSSLSQNQIDGIDFRKSVVALWQRRVLLLGTTLAFTLGAYLITLMQTRVYQAEAVLRIDLNPFVETQIYSQAQFIEIGTTDTLSYLESPQVLEAINTSISNSAYKIDALSFSADLKGNIIVRKQADSPQEAYQDVLAYVNNINAIYKLNELYKVQVALDTIEPLLNAHQGVVNEFISRKYSELLVQQAMLQSSESIMIKVTSEPVLPVEYIKPMTGLVVFLGTLLGLLLGITIVLSCLAWKKENL